MTNVFERACHNCKSHKMNNEDNPKERTHHCSHPYVAYVDEAGMEVWPYCDEARMIGLCGSDGKLWEQKADD